MDYLQLDYHREPDRFSTRALDLVGTEPDPNSRPPMDWLNQRRQRRADEPDSNESGIHRHIYRDEF